MKENKYPMIFMTKCCGTKFEFTHDGQMLYCNCWDSNAEGEDNPGIAVDIGDGYYMRTLGHNFDNVVEMYQVVGERKDFKTTWNVDPEVFGQFSDMVEPDDEK